MAAKKKKSELDQQIEAVIGGKWFFPILQKIDEFEGSADISPEYEEILDDDCPQWVFNLMVSGAKLDAEYTGFGPPSELDARRIGSMVGSKWVICQAYARAYPILMGLSEKQVVHIETAFGKGSVPDLVELTAKFVVKYTPRFREVKKYAVELAEEQAFTEYIQYLQGFKQGIEFLGRAQKRMQPTEKKQGKDTQARLAVYGFILGCWQEIEQHKSEKSWREITDDFSKKTGYDDIDEATLKKILSRAGLKGIGKVGRPSLC